MPDQLGKELLKIIKTFSPKDRELLQRKGQYWSVLKNNDYFGTKKFSVKSLVKYAQNHEEKNLQAVKYFAINDSLVHTLAAYAFFGFIHSLTLISTVYSLSTFPTAKFQFFTSTSISLK
jgi:hypothetical protein